MEITRIAEVVEELNQIIDHCKANNSRMGYFAILYKNMTIAVQQAIINGAFEDGERMEKLDVIFACRYLDAWKSYQQQTALTASWKKAFDSAASPLTVIQHLMLGINTHINLDLAIAASLTAPGEKIVGLQADFEKINEIIAALTDEMQAKLERIWWPMWFLKRITNGKEKAVINWSITHARTASWTSANALALLTDPETNAGYIDGMDRTVEKLCEGILNPGKIASIILKPVQWLEHKDPAKVMARLE